MRWSLGSMFSVTVLVAVAAWLAKHYVVAGSGLLYILAIPFFMGLGVGMLTGNVGRWIRYGVAADVVLLGLLFLDRFIR
jgi:hypothetical protein